MIYKVSKDNLKKGLRLDAGLCPLALCFSQAHPKAKIRVGVQNMWVRTSSPQAETIARTIPLPVKLQKFVVAFDTGTYTGGPFSFRMKRIVKD